jgi:signal transduction histidine kinase
VVDFSSNVLRGDAEELVQQLSGAAADETRSFLAERVVDIRAWSASLLLQDPASTPELKSKLLASVAAQNGCYREISLVDRQGTVVASSRPELVGTSVKAAPWFQPGKAGISDLLHDGQRPQLMVTHPAGTSGQTIVARLDLQHVLEVFNKTWVRQSGEAYLLAGNGQMISTSRFPNGNPGAPMVDTQGARAARQGHVGIATYRDYRGVEVIGAYTPLQLPLGGPARWVILGEIDVAEAMAPAHRLAGMVWTITGGLVVLMLLLIAFTTRRISRPLHELDEGAQALAAGDLDRRVAVLTEDEFGRAAASFNHMADRLQAQVAKLQELDQFKNDYIHAISHDLRAPLTVIKGYVELLDDSDGTVQHDYTGHIDRAARRLQAMADDLLDAARLEAGTFALDLEQVDLAELLRPLVDELQPVAADAGIRLAFEAPDAPVLVRIDRERICRVVANLVGNALKFTAAGGSVRVKVGADATCAVIDTGEGIAAEDLPRLFLRFSQLEAGQRKRGSTGLGLAICKAIVEAHGGTIGVESEPGKGSTFWFGLNRT